jgi:hypothetical protein
MVEYGFSSDEETEVDSELEIEIENMNQVELCEFGATLGVDTTVDTHLLWLVEEAYSSPVPQGWTVCYDDEGDTYYFHELTGETTWVHPTDKTYREVLRVIRTIENDAVATQPQTQSKIMEIIDDHLREMQAKATSALEEWSGPHDAGDGKGQFYHNTQTRRSSWYSPRDEWENEIYLHYALLHRFVSRGVAADADTLTAYPKSFPRSPSVSNSQLYKRRVSFASSGFRTPCSQAPLTPHSDLLDDMTSPCSAKSCKRGYGMQTSCPKLKSPTGSMLFARRKTVSFSQSSAVPAA